MREVLAGHNRTRGGYALMADVRAAFGVPAEGLPFGDFAATLDAESICRAIEANIQPSPLVAALQPAGERCPLFLIHAGGGYVSFYRALATHLGPHHPVFGIRAETEADGLGHPLDRCKSLEQLAARYITRMKAIQPRGPYAVGGGSFGAVVAFEMARQLDAAGDTVQMVLMFSPELLTEPGADGTGRLGRRMAFHLHAARQLEPGSALRYVSHKILRSAGSEALAVLRRIRDDGRSARRAPARADQPQVARREPLAPDLAYRSIVNLRAGARLLMKYRPEPYAGCLTIFRAERDRDPAPQWDALARGGIQLFAAGRGHLEMLEEPAVESVAAIVGERLNQRSGDPSRTIDATQSRRSTFPVE